MCFSFPGRVSVCPILSGASLQAFRCKYLTYQPGSHKRKVPQELFSLYIQQMFRRGSAASQRVLFCVDLLVRNICRFLYACRQFCSDLNHQLAQRLHDGGKESQTEEALKRYQRYEHGLPVRRRFSNTKRQGWAGESSSHLLKCPFFLYLRACGLLLAMYRGTRQTLLFCVRNPASPLHRVGNFAVVGRWSSTRWTT